ncbi:MAG: hypothetical protein RR796_04250 [Victivallaceae bacterium]
MITSYNDSLVYAACMTAANALSDVSDISLSQDIQNVFNFCTTIPSLQTQESISDGKRLYDHFKLGQQFPKLYIKTQSDREEVLERHYESRARLPKTVFTTSYVNGVPVYQKVDVVYSNYSGNDFWNCLLCLYCIRPLTTAPSSGSRESDKWKVIIVLILIAVILLCLFVSTAIWTCHQGIKLKESVKRTKVLSELVHQISVAESNGGDAVQLANDMFIVRDAILIEKKITAISRMKVAAGTVTTVALVAMLALVILGCLVLSGVAGGPTMITALIALGSIGGGALLLSLTLFLSIALYKTSAKDSIVRQSCTLVNSLITEANNKMLGQQHA